MAPVSYVGGFNIGTVAAIPPALASKSHNSVSPHMSLSHLPPMATISPLEPKVSACKQEFVCWPFKRKLGFPAAFCLSLSLSQQEGRGIPADFHSQMLCGILFPALVYQTGELCVELRPLDSQGTSAAEISIQILNCHTWL